jgi:hypothetical protein
MQADAAQKRTVKVLTAADFPGTPIANIVARLRRVRQDVAAHVCGVFRSLVCM